MTRECEIAVMFGGREIVLSRRMPVNLDTGPNEVMFPGWSDEGATVDSVLVLESGRVVASGGLRKPVVLETGDLLRLSIAVDVTGQINFVQPRV